MKKTRRMVLVTAILVTLIGGSALAFQNKYSTNKKTIISNVSDNNKSNLIDNKKEKQELDKKPITKKNIGDKVVKRTKSTKIESKNSEDLNSKQDSNSVFSTKDIESKPIAKKRNITKTKVIKNNTKKAKTHKKITICKRPIVHVHKKGNVKLKKTSKNYKISKAEIEKFTGFKDIELIDDVTKWDNQEKDIKEHPEAYSKDKNGNLIINLDKLP